MSQSSSVATELDIVERLRHNHEMLKDGHQNNLTELWHSETVKDAAADALEAAIEIERLRGPAQSPRTPIDREQIAALLYVTRYPNKIWMAASGLETAVAYEQADVIIRTLSSTNQSAPDALGSLPSGESDPLVTLDYSGADTATEMAEKSVAQAIWRAHKDNYNLRMHEVYPLMARAAIGAMREHIRSPQETAE